MGDGEPVELGMGEDAGRAAGGAAAGRSARPSRQAVAAKRAACGRRAALGSAPDAPRHGVSRPAGRMAWGPASSSRAVRTCSGGSRPRPRRRAACDSSPARWSSTADEEPGWPAAPRSVAGASPVRARKRYKPLVLRRHEAERLRWPAFGGVRGSSRATGFYLPRESAGFVYSSTCRCYTAIAMSQTSPGRGDAERLDRGRRARICQWQRRC